MNEIWSVLIFLLQSAIIGALAGGALLLILATAFGVAHVWRTWK